MSCCTPIIKTFLSETETVIPYPSSSQDIYGPAPTVKVLYLIEGEYVESTGFLTAISLHENQIVVNHGGSASGIIKIN